MAEVSRTARVIQNAKVALFFCCINLILQFFSRKIFLDYLGAELLGLNTTAQNLLQFLNLAESGIGAAVAFALYKPLSQGNRQEIIDIVSLQGWFYRWVGLFVIAGSVVLMAFFPWIFAKAQVPLIYAYGTFIAFLISALLGYFVNYKMIVLSADQKEYKITIETQTIKIVKVLIQMLAIWKLPHGYVWWMSLEALASVIIAIRLNHCVQKEYPWLKSAISRGKCLRLQYSFLLKKIKQLFFHKIGGFVLNQTTPLIIYGYTTLTTVAVYGNYMIIMSGCLMIVEAFSRGLNASVGNLVSEGDIAQIKKIFWQIVTLRLFIAALISCGLFFLSESFTTLWVGPEFVMSPLPLMIMIAIYFIQMSRTADIFLWAYGLFQDIWAPIIEAVLNILLSIFLGYFLGLTGIFAGVLISQIVVVNSWKAIFLFKYGFKSNVLEYVFLYTKKICLVLVTSIFVYFIVETFLQWPVLTYFDWAYKAVIICGTFMLIGGIVFTFLDSHFRQSLARLKKVIETKI